ncbi:uroporphyrin-III C-methyltransferase [Leptolyngbyaceae cyanobacterium JSC-12]|nr:uroporphyrin-III C-methyltransferase [Leptolyngbyaceae cyanobacterium JSC-12]
MAERAGKVYLVGSGPGDAAYLTVQAREILAQAEVLVYDALVDGELIELVPETCLKLDVGKRGGQPSTPQSEINRLLVKHCQQGKLVVRLKNGDPFIFGRAQSEIGALKQADCEFEIVPGLSSALVAPLMAGIPLTDPQLSQSFTVVTAHNPDALNWVSLTKLDTLVFLMGGRTLPEIVRRLRGHGRSPYTPIAIIRYAGRQQQQIWDGTLNTILDKTAGIPLSPCVIVVGEVVKLRTYIGEQGGQTSEARSQKPEARRREVRGEGSKGAGGDRADQRKLSSSPPPSSSPIPNSPTPDSSSSPSPHLPISPSLLPLADKTILVTRAASQSNQFTSLLEEQGARVIEMPTLEIGPPSSWRDLDRAIAAIEDFDWLILTSTNGVDYFFQRLEEITGERTFSTNIKIAVVGEKTAQRLLKLGIQPDFVPPHFVADSLVANFPEPLAGLRVLFPRVESGGREVLVKEFTSQGAKVREVAAYESRCPDAIAPPALRALQKRKVDVVTFASSKTVQHFCQLLQPVSDDWQTWLKDVGIASIGPQTSASCQALLGRVDIEAEEYTLEGLTAAIIKWAMAEPAEATAIAEGTESISPDSTDSPETSPLPEVTEPANAVASLEMVTVEDSAGATVEFVPEATVVEDSPTATFNQPDENLPGAEAVLASETSVAEPTLESENHLEAIESEIFSEIAIADSVIDVELVAEAESPDSLDTLQAQLDPKTQEFLTAEAQLIAEIQAVIEQDDYEPSESDRPASS